MKIRISLIPNINKKLNDIICDIIDSHADSGLLKAGIIAGYRVAGVFGDGGTNMAVNMFRSVLDDLLKNVLDMNRIYADVKIRLVEKSGEKVSAKLDAENINYTDSVIENLPRILDALSMLPSDHILLRVLDILDDDKEDIAATLLNALSDDKKEAVSKLLIKEYQSNLCEFLTKILQDNEIHLAVAELYIEDEIPEQPSVRKE